MHHFITAFIITVLLGFADVLSATTEPSSTTSLVSGFRFHTGFLINHHNRMKILNEKPPQAYEFFIAKTTAGEKSWNSFYGYPQIGVSYMLFDLGSPSFIGNAHCVYPFVNFFLTDVERIISLNMQFNAGGAYVEKIFDPVDNYKNTVVSTHLNAILGVGIEGRLRLFKNMYLSGGLAFTHISNGTFKKPNAGANFVTTFAATSYQFSVSSLKMLANFNPEYSNLKPETSNLKFEIYFSGGIKSYTIYDDKKYAISGLSFELSRSHLDFTCISGAFELFYDTSDYASLHRNEIKTSRLQTVKPGITAGYSFLFGKFSAIVQAGGYLYAKNHEYGFIYQRLALKYYVSEHISFRLGLKTHWGQADYLELSIGYKIK